jgi:enoyl-CoA hydratase
LTAALSRNSVHSECANRAALDATEASMSFETILYETPTEHIVRIVLNRLETRNAQNTRMLYELNQAFDRAAQDDAVKVVILAANGAHFS